MSLDNLQDRLMEQLQDIYDAEQQLVKAVPKMAKAELEPASVDRCWRRPAGRSRTRPGQVRARTIYGGADRLPTGSEGHILRL